jgi:hypothetical protein
MIGFLCSLTLCFIDHHEDFIISILLLGAFFGFTSVLLINWIATPHLFPVLYTSSCQGLGNAFGRFAGILAPQLAEINQPIPMIILSSLSLATAILSLMLKPLPKNQ